MQVLKSTTLKTIELELDEKEVDQLILARAELRGIINTKLNLSVSETKGLETSICLISTVLGNHQ